MAPDKRTVEVHFFKKRSKLISKLSREYKDNPKLLLKALSNPKNKSLYADNEITLEDVENDVSYKELLPSDESDYEENEGEVVKTQLPSTNVQRRTKSRTQSTSGDMLYIHI